MEVKTKFIDDLLLAAVRRHPQFRNIPKQEWLYFDMALHAVDNHPCVCFRYKSTTSWRAQVWLDLSSATVRVRVNCVVSFQEVEAEIARLGVTLCGFDRPPRKQDRVIPVRNEARPPSAINELDWEVVSDQPTFTFTQERSVQYWPKSEGNNV